MRLLGMLISIGLVALIACAQSQKTVESPIERGVASGAAPSDFDPNRENFDGSFTSIFRELKLMRGNLERSSVLGISHERDNLLKKNLYDTGVDGGQDDCKAIMAYGRNDLMLHHRTPSGLCYMYKQGPNMQGAPEADLSGLTKMGAAGQRFGRNSPPVDEAKIAEHQKNVMEPNPVTVSQTFFSRKPELAPATNGFQPVPWVNLLASAWLQAENHDWFSHGKNVDTSHISGPDAERFANAFKPYVVGEFIIPRTMPDLSFFKGQNPGQKYEKNAPPKSLEAPNNRYGAKYRNAVTHWWDASHIYGSDPETVLKIRTIPSGVTATGSDGKTYGAGAVYPDGKIAVDEQARKLYYRADPKNDNEVLPITGFNDNWWVGLEMIHTIFALEHNKVAEHLRKTFDSSQPHWGPLYGYYHSIKNDPAKKSQFLYDKSRLVVAALIAKIHTVEWTPALLDNPGLRMGMFINWHGAKTAIGDIESPTLRKWVEKVRGTESRMLISGLTGKGTLNLYKVPFTLTEEFVSVYRMHPLLADKVDLIRYTDRNDAVSASVAVNDTRDTEAERIVNGMGFSSTDVLYSFGRNKAGLMTLHNYPKFMERMEVRRNTLHQPKDRPVVMNMGATDIVRDRERMTPRYNDFRRMMRMRPLKNFEELFITSKVLYEDASTKSEAYKAALAKIRAGLAAAGFDMPTVERDISKIPDFSYTQYGKFLVNGDYKAILDDGKTLATEDEFYKYYFALTKAEQQALLTPQEIEDIANMKKIYGDVEKLDLLVGTLAEEDRYDMFGFGNTPFYIFALMASRRLMTDPFLSDLYTKEVYSQYGLDWVEKNTMVDVIKRNFPELSSHFEGVKNAFHPWNPSPSTN